jgi:hypothetical protein
MLRKYSVIVFEAVGFCTANGDFHKSFRGPAASKLLPDFVCFLHWKLFMSVPYWKSIIAKSGYHGYGNTFCENWLKF